MINRCSKIFSLTTSILFQAGRARQVSNLQSQGSVLLPLSIHNLHDNPGSRKLTKPLGRGPANGKGKFAGRGMKGYKARAGGSVHPRFEGGQTPLQARLPKYGRVKRTHNLPPLTEVNLSSIDYFVKRSIINPAETITIKVLHDVGIIKKVKTGVKILGKGAQRIDYPLHFEVSDASQTVVDRVRELGGSIKFIFRTPLKLREHLYPQKFPLPLAEPIPGAYQIRKLQRVSMSRGVEIRYRKPQWKLQDEQKQSQIQKQAQQFVYPVPRTPNPEKIRKRKSQLYRKINYGL